MTEALRMDVEQLREQAGELAIEQHLLLSGWVYGFTDQAHLARSFRSVTGQTPSSYRREFRALGAPSPEGRFPMQAPPVRSPRASA